MRWAPEPCPQEGEFSTKVSFQGPAVYWKGSAFAEAALGQLNPATDHSILFYSVHQDVLSPLQDFSCSVVRTYPCWEQNGQWVTKPISVQEKEWVWYPKYCRRGQCCGTARGSFSHPQTPTTGQAEGLGWLCSSKWGCHFPRKESLSQKYPTCV